MKENTSLYLRVLESVSRLDRIGINFLRIAILIVFGWIGGLKVCHYEAEGIVPFVTNSPAMNFFYSSKAPEYKKFMHPEGAVIEKDSKWHEANNTYTFSYGLGSMIVFISLLVVAGIKWPTLGMIGGGLVFGMAMVTLSFLITTPEVWVPNRGGEHGFPLLSGAGRLVIKDVIMMAGGIIIMAWDAKRILAKKLNS